MNTKEVNELLHWSVEFVGVKWRPFYGCILAEVGERETAWDPTSNIQHMAMVLEAASTSGYWDLVFTRWVEKYTPDGISASLLTLGVFRDPQTLVQTIKEVVENG